MLLLQGFINAVLLLKQIRFSREAKEAVVADSFSETVSEEMLSVSLLFVVSEVEPAEEQPASRETARVQMQRRDKSTLFS